MNFYIKDTEAISILLSIFFLSLAVSIAYLGIENITHLSSFVRFFSAMIIGVGSGFVFHELAHKFVAIHFGAYAEFKMWVQGIFFALLTSLFHVVFAAPGAVVIYARNLSKREHAMISIAGPTVNIVLAVFFFYLSSIHPIVYPLPDGDSFEVWMMAGSINAILALFNMIPLRPLDGEKIWKWNKAFWFAFTILFLAVVLLL